MADLGEVDFENPHPCIHGLFAYYNQLYFEEKLGACTLKWSSKRMTLCAGVCHFSAFGGCDIRLSEPILKFRPVSDLKNTLLHEMIHAYLFLTEGNKDHDDHGPCFQNMMMKINDCHIADEERPPQGYEITVYHKFVDEVESYRVHHWKCTKCQDLIKRAMNRTPSVSDCFTRSETCSHPHCHWHMHKKLCGGIYEKIHEPPGYIDKRKQPALQAIENIKQSDQSVDNFSGTCTLNGQKRKNTSSVGGVSKRGTKEPLGGAKFSTLEHYFPPVDSDKETIPETDITDVQMDTPCDKSTEIGIVNDNFVVAKDMNGKSTVCMEGSSDEKGSSSGKVEEDTWLTTEEDPSSLQKEEEIDIGSPAIEMGDTVDKTTNVDVRNILPAIETGPEDTADKTTTVDSKNIPSSKRIMTRSTRAKEYQSKETEPRQDRPGMEHFGTGFLSRRKRFKTIHELHENQNLNDPVVILAWANWVTYEIDEENEEPLINKRTQRRMQAKDLELGDMKAKSVADLIVNTEVMETEELQGLSEYSKTIPDELPKKATVDGLGQNFMTETHSELIELSDDENIVVKGETFEIPRVSAEQASLDLRDRRPEDSSGLKSSIRMKASARSRGREGSSTLKVTDLRRGSSEQSGIMTCPICTLAFEENDDNTVVNEHIDDCLRQSS